MKVNYISNDWEYGEQSVAFLGDRILFVCDLGDGFIDLRDSRAVYEQIQFSLKTNEEIEFETVDNPPDKVIKALKDYLRI